MIISEEDKKLLEIELEINTLEESLSALDDSNSNDSDIASNIYQRLLCLQQQLSTPKNHLSLLLS